MSVTLHFNDGQSLVEWMREKKDIDNSIDEEDDDDDVLKEDDVTTEASDEVDHAAKFLREVGFGHLAQNEKADDSELYSLLTVNQLATVRKRLETVRARAKSHRPDVRDIFSSSSSAEHQTDGAVLQSMRNAVLQTGRKKDHQRVEAKGSTDSSAKSKEAEARVDAGREENEIEIPPPDYPSIGPQIIQVGIGMVRPTSPNLLSPRDKTREFELPGSGRQSPMTPDGLLSSDDGSVLTRISDLGRKDLKMLNALANIELMTVFDECNIKYIQHKSKKKGKDHGVYGVPLQTLADKDRRKSNDLSGSSAPVFLQLLIEYLERMGLAEEGILRVPGAVARMRELRNEIDTKWPRGKFSFDGIAVNDAAGLLKQFLRDLPDSLLTLEKMDAFLKILELPEEKRLYALNLLLIILPTVNRDSLQLLLGFLRKIIDEESNRMTLTSVAMIIAPNLFVVRSGGAGQVKTADIDAEMEMAAKTSKAVAMLIEFKDDIYTVPQSLLAQIRQKNDTRRTRINLPVIGRRDRSDAYRQTATFDRNSVTLIQVSLEDSSNEKAISISNLTTSNDVINQVLVARSPKPNRKALKSSGNAKLDMNENSSGRHESSLTPPSLCESSFLYEVGGNIGERRLDGTTHVMNVIQVNPNAKFIVRHRPT